MITQRAPLAPFFAPQWGNCSGSVLANLESPGIEHPRTRGGSASHWVASESLQLWVDPLKTFRHCDDWVGQQAPNGTIIDPEMAEGAQFFVDEVLMVAQEHGALQNILIEHRVNMPGIHEDGLNWGILDAAIPIFKRNREGGIESGRIYLFDYKFGHRENRAEGHLQLINYMIGLMEEFNIGGLEDQRVSAVLRVVQPFSYHAANEVDEWRIWLSDLRPYMTQLTAKAHDAFNNPTFTTGPHCRDCGSRGSCEALRQSNYALIDHVNRPPKIDKMTVGDLAVEMGILDSGIIVAKARLDAINDELKHKISSGATGSGLSVQSTLGRLKWQIPTAQAISFSEKFGVDVAKPGVITPTQAIKSAPKGIKKEFKDAIQSVASRDITGLKLIAATDSRTARAFSKKKVV